MNTNNILILYQLKPETEIAFMTDDKNLHKKKTPVQYLRVGDDYEGQRIDNFLIAKLKGMPKSHVYRILWKGEVRVNKKRVSPFYKLIAGDDVRLPPVIWKKRQKWRHPVSRRQIC